MRIKKTSLAISLVFIASCFGPKYDIPNERGLLKDTDGNLYKTIRVGNLWWMAENLRVTRYNNGDIIYNQLNTNYFAGDLTGSFTSHFSDKEFINKYGLLYNWLAVDNPSGLCPSGWRVPSDEDWMDLEKNVLIISSKELNRKGWRGEGAGILKDTDTLTWRYPNVGATNQLEFNARPAGYVSGSDFENLYNIGYWWTSTTPSQNHAYSRELYFYNDKISRTKAFIVKAYSVRCVREE